ncbi:hypothetical protein [Paenibacillus mendelii]|uniref:Uncharacterized protein n=1 Tax=Paenibacillus mendelii TaxID=206163 RepID=A0ABV6JFU9_9BACL|nr:hypothetical protein [Paenibacillus mendelii]MCQ6557674.1 hypothetical protein [Paenibacillus mendelii]
MSILKNFFLVVLNLVGELWTGVFHRNPDFYDKYTVTKSRTGYVFFVALSTLVTIGIVAWFYVRIYGP